VATAAPGFGWFNIVDTTASDTPLLPQINNLIRVQAVAVPGILNVCDDRVVTNFRLFESQNFRHSVSQLWRSRIAPLPVERCLYLTNPVPKPLTTTRPDRLQPKLPTFFAFELFS